MTQQTTTDISAQIAQVFSDAGATGHLYAREIGGTAEVTVNGDTPVVLASVFKIFVLTAFWRAVEAGEIDPTDTTNVPERYRVGGVGFAGFTDDVTVTWRDLAQNMMTLSDNAATDVLFHKLGQERVDQVIADLGLQDTILIGCCEDLFAGIAEEAGFAPDADLATVLATLNDEQLGALSCVSPLRTTHSTPREVATLLEGLWTDTVAPAAACESARNIMAQQVWPHRLSSGFPSDPSATFMQPGVTIAAKTGTLPFWRNEAGVVAYPDGRRFLVTVFTRANTSAARLPQVDASIGTAGRLAVEHLRSLG